MIGDDWLKLDCNKLSKEFDRWLRMATETSYWSQQNQKGQIICWKSFWDASKHESKKSDFNSPGCYLLGVGSCYDNIRIRYVGETGETLKSRLTRRYISTKKPDNFDVACIKQLNMAAWLAGCGNDWRKLPDHIIATYYFIAPKGIDSEDGEAKRKHPDTRIRARIKHAMDLAEHIAQYGKNGSDHLWFALIPMKRREQTQTKKLEHHLIDILNRRNEEHNNPRLLNDVPIAM